MANLNGYSGKRFPVDPLIPRVERLGGIGKATERSGLPQAQRDNLRKRYREAKAVGTVTTAAADTICIDVLGCLPQEVWGQAWWED